MVSSIDPVATSEKAVLGQPLVPVFTCFPDGREELRLVGMNGSPGTAASMLLAVSVRALREQFLTSLPSLKVSHMFCRKEGFPCGTGTC